MQIFVPTADRQGTRFPQQYYTDLKQELAGLYGGVTIYARSPVKGIWKPDNNSIEADDLIIFEVLVNQLDLSYFSSLKARLEATFKQNELLMRYFGISLVR
nr:hypothetical protein [uncultured Dyadobacter sp.]